MTIEKAKTTLEKYRKSADDEMYHSEFDDILEERLRDLDPHFMNEMTKLYHESGMSRWCA